MSKEEYYLWLGMIDGISNTTKKRLLDYFGDIETLWSANRDDLSKLLNDHQIEILMSMHSSQDMQAYSRRIEERQISILYAGHPKYPEKLLTIPDAPVVLFAVGNRWDLLAENTRCLAVVGSRNLSPYGKQTVCELIKGLMQYHVVIISGMAAGVDGLAHKETLAGGGNTIGILGSGINVPYPRMHVSLYHEMSERGLILSEYGLDVSPAPWHFPLRNRIISGLSDAVLIIEAREKSGSLITADQALEQGRDVAAVPGRIHDMNSAGCNYLIKNGAACITSVQDIADLMDLTKITSDEECEKIILAPREKMVYSCVRLEPRHIDDICKELDLRVSDILEILFDLEQKGIVKQPFRNHFVRN